jgi:hypothetical protein
LYGCVYGAFHVSHILVYEPLVHTPNIFDVETVTEKLKMYKSPDELIQAGGEKFRSDTHKLIYTIWNDEESPP